MQLPGGMVVAVTWLTHISFHDIASVYPLTPRRRLRTRILPRNTLLAPKVRKRYPQYQAYPVLLCWHQPHL
jgi:hypothetical protein